MSEIIYTLKVNKDLFEEIKCFYTPYMKENKGDYVSFMAKINTVTITGYESQKETKKITFSGKDAYIEAKKWDKNLSRQIKKKEKIKKHWLDYEDQIGSDEVGVGDFLLPVIVVASFVAQKDIKKLIALGVEDSKNINDQKILKIGKELIKFIPYSKLTLSNRKYNEVILKGENLNSIKAKMHNRALLNLHHQYLDVTHIYVDQFVNEKKYYEYLNDKQEEKVMDISFKTKGESYFPSIAVSSIIARYYFLLEREKLNKKYHTEFPFGAGSKVNAFSKSFIQKFGKEEFDKIAKNNFANFRKLL